MVSANKLYKMSGSTLPFKDWLSREKAKGKFIPNVEAMEEFYNADGAENAPEAQTETITAQSVQNKQMMKNIVRIALIGALAYFVYKQVKK